VVGATSPSPINYGDDDDDAIDVMGHDGEVDHDVDEDSGRRLRHDRGEVDHDVDEDSGRRLGHDRGEVDHDVEEDSGRRLGHGWGEVGHDVEEDSGRRLDSNANRCSDDDQHLLPPLGADDKLGWHRRRGLSVAEADTGSAVEVARSCYCVCRRPPSRRRRRRRRISGLADFFVAAVNRPRNIIILLLRHIQAAYKHTDTNS